MRDPVVSQAGCCPNNYDDAHVMVEYYSNQYDCTRFLHLISLLLFTRIGGSPRRRSSTAESPNNFTSERRHNPCNQSIQAPIPHPNPSRRKHTISKCRQRTKKFPFSSTPSSPNPSNTTTESVNSHSPNVPLQQKPVKANKENQVLNQLHSLTSFLLGLTAGILALQSATGFIFYFIGTIIVSGLFHLVLLYRSNGKGAGGFYPGSGGEIDGLVVRKDGVVKDAGTGLRKGAWRDVWFGGGVFGEALSGFVLGWAGVGGVLR